MGRTTVHCICGKTLGEISEDASGFVWVSCPNCRDLVADYGFDGEPVRRGRLLVLQRVDLDTGSVPLSGAEVFQDFQRGDRSPTRGGRRLDASIITQALARRRELAARKGNDTCQA